MLVGSAIVAFAAQARGVAASPGAADIFNIDKQHVVAVEGDGG
jgi:hypothetical protein